MQSPARILSSSLPADVQVSELPDGVRYDLPGSPPEAFFAVWLGQDLSSG
jgi:hypothetical protein